MIAAERVLLLAPIGRDAPVTRALLEQSGVECLICNSLADLLERLNEGAGAALVTEEALRDGAREALSVWVSAQPPWSDFPFIVMGKGGTAPRTAQAIDVLESLGNIVLLERPLQAEALIRAARSALQARRRQYEVRAFAGTLEATVIDRTRELESARESLAIALEAAEMGSWDLDLATDTSIRSPRHDEIFGYSSPLPRWGKAQFSQHVAPEDLERVNQAFESAVAAGHLEFECRIVRADRQVRWISVKGRVAYEQGVARRIVGVIADVSERKEADAQLAQVQKMDTIGHLTGGVAHDFNNLLTPIVGGLDLLRRRHREDPQSQRLIGAALQAGERAATLTQRLLAFARRQTLQPQTVNAGALVEGLVDLVRRTLGPKVEVKLDFPADLPAVRVDPHQLELALLNLAVNARDAMPSGGTLTISAAAHRLPPDNELALPPDEYVAISTQDEGVGMDATTLQRAIEPFFSTKGVGKGTGLGLSMAHGLAAQSGGALTIKSALGEGTTIALWLPSTKERAPSRLEDGANAMPARTSATILLVDDEELVRRATADMLNDLGYQVVQAASGSRALSMLKSGIEADLIVSDYLMPGMSGGALHRELRDDGVETPFLLITGYAQKSEDVAPGVPTLAKPFRQRELADRITQLLSAGETV